jgi:hypothetical protein
MVQGCSQNVLQPIFWVNAAQKYVKGSDYEKGVLCVKFEALDGFVLIVQKLWQDASHFH